MKFVVTTSAGDNKPVVLGSEYSPEYINTCCGNKLWRVDSCAFDVTHTDANERRYLEIFTLTMIGQGLPRVVGSALLK